MEQIYDLNDIWSFITSKLKNIEIQTKKLNKEIGLWFSVNIIDENIIISKSIKNKPSSKIKNIRNITKNEFCNIYPYYQEWKNNKISRAKIRNISQNTSYIFAIINYYETIIEKGHCT